MEQRQELVPGVSFCIVLDANLPPVHGVVKYAQDACTST